MNNISVATIWINPSTFEETDNNVHNKITHFVDTLAESNHNGTIYLFGQKYTNEEKNLPVTLNITYVDVDNTLFSNDSDLNKKIATIMEKSELYSKIDFIKILALQYMLLKFDSVVLCDIDMLNKTECVKDDIFDVSLSNILRIVNGNDNGNRNKKQKTKIYANDDNNFLICFRDDNIIKYLLEQTITVTNCLYEISKTEFVKIHPKTMMAINNIIYRHYKNYATIPYDTIGNLWFSVLFKSIVNNEKKYFDEIINLVKTFNRNNKYSVHEIFWLHNFLTYLKYSTDTTLEKYIRNNYKFDNNNKEKKEKLYDLLEIYCNKISTTINIKYHIARTCVDIYLYPYAVIANMYKIFKNIKMDVSVPYSSTSFSQDGIDEHFIEDTRQQLIQRHLLQKS